MKSYITLLFLLVSSYCSAQYFEFSYDAVGNRTKRIVVTPRLASPNAKIDSVNSTESKFGIRVFPNPVSEKITVNISSLEAGEIAKVYLSNADGKILLKREQTSQEEVIDLTEFMAGIYYIKVYIKLESVSYKIVKL